MVTTLDMILAFDDCFRNKRSSDSAVSYEAERMFEDLPKLAREINERTYEPGQSITFVVTRPRYREVFAASFRDRIVHHWMCMRIEPLLESMLCERRFNCRKSKGTLAAVKSLREDIKEVSRGYTSDCYVAKGDIKGFFMGIDKPMLAVMVDMLIVACYGGDDKEDLRWVTRKVIMHSPEKNCILNTPKSLWRHLSKDKSLFTNGENKGVPIGNLPSQELANLLLHVALDLTLNRLQRQAEVMGITFRWNGYIDDFGMVSDNKAFLLVAYPQIRQSLGVYGLRLNEKKCWIQHYTKGVQFVGAFVKGRKCYPIHRTAKSMRKAADRLMRAESEEQARRALNSLNSYVGMMIHYDTYRLRRSALVGLYASPYCFAVGTSRKP